MWDVMHPAVQPETLPRLWREVRVASVEPLTVAEPGGDPVPAVNG